MNILTENPIKLNKRRSIRTQPRERKFNFLKYWRIVRYYIKRKYKISLSEHDMLLYLYDLPYFKREDFNYYSNSMSWDKKRFYKMMQKGLIKEWRGGGVKFGRSKIYELTHLAKTICSTTYKKLVKEELISEDPRSNPIFKKETYTDKVYKSIIEKMNSR